MSDLILGVDPSLTATAYLAMTPAGQVVTKSVARGKDLRGAERLDFHDVYLQAIIEDIDPAFVVIEGYAYGRQNQRETLGEHGGVLRLRLWRAGIPTMVVAPPTLKKFVTGKGSCPKSIMIKEVYRRWSFDTDDDNLADAYSLAQVGRAWLNPDTRSKTLESILKKALLLSGASK